jgi:asparagine synthase (glutamine-hydrolysing)
MSGIVGILDRDGAPLDQALLQQLTAHQSFRGPDAQKIWVNHHSGLQVGFGHTLLKTTEEAGHEEQPFSLDGEVWIVADARVDAQRELIAKLEARGQEAGPVASDAELILRAYQVWGEDCVEHLLGDFAFGIWDEGRQRLFCARDHMGVKPFYYASIGSLFIFSNTLDCLRMHPAVSGRLNDLAIADFLLFEMNQDPATTSFADIQRLPAAHCASISREGLRVRRYWTMPVDEPLFYRRADDYTDRFKELLRAAVGDRLRTDKIGIFMSGGIDSPTLAAVSLELMRERYASFDLQAYTKVNPLNPEERRYAGLVASHLGIAINDCDWGDLTLDPDWESTPFHTPEPRACPWELRAFQLDGRKIGAFSRVFIHGEGPDNALRFEWQVFLSFLWRERRLAHLFHCIGSTMFSQRVPPFWGRISRIFRRATSDHSPAQQSSLPVWLNAEFESRLQLRHRVVAKQKAAPLVNPWRPLGYESLHSPLWQESFEAFDPGAGVSCFEVRHPFVDLRMLRYLLAVPALPWCRAKYLLRRSMRKALPETVLRRPKTGVPMAPMLDRLSQVAMKTISPAPHISRYVQYEKIASHYNGDLFALGIDLRARALNYWLQNSHTLMHNRF